MKKVLWDVPVKIANIEEHRSGMKFDFMIENEDGTINIFNAPSGFCDRIYKSDLKDEILSGKALRLVAVLTTEPKRE